MSHKSYSKMRQTLDSFQKDYKNPTKTDIDDDDPQTPTKSVSYNMSTSNPMTFSFKPILKPTTSRKKAKKSQISNDNTNMKKTHFKKPLREIHVVESYKEYNIDVSDEGGSWFCGFSCFFQKKKMQK